MVKNKTFIFIKVYKSYHFSASVHNRHIGIQRDRSAMSRSIKSRLPFGVSSRLDNQRDYTKAICLVTYDNTALCDVMFDVIY